MRTANLGAIKNSTVMEAIKGEFITGIGAPDVLLGIRDFWQIFIRKREIGQGYFCIDTTIGQVICGANQRENLENEKSIQTHMAINPANINEMPSESEIKSWWDLQSIGITDDPQEKDDEIAQAIFDKSIRQVNGRYRTRWLWKEKNPDLPCNFGIAYRCLESLLNRFQNNKGMETLERIDKTIKEQVTSEVVEITERRKGSLEHFTSPPCF